MEDLFQLLFRKCEKYFTLSEIVDKHIIASLMSHRWQEGTSAVNNAYKALTNLVGEGQIEKGDGFFRLKGCKSEFGTHARLVSLALAVLMKLERNGCEVYIVRESTIEEIGLRPDAIVCIKKGNKSVCFILEVANHETESYLTQKVNAWRNWDKACEHLSTCFIGDSDIKNNKFYHIKIPCFDIVVEGLSVPGTFEFKEYVKHLQEVING